MATGCGSPWTVSQRNSVGVGARPAAGGSGRCSPDRTLGSHQHGSTLLYCPPGITATWGMYGRGSGSRGSPVGEAAGRAQAGGRHRTSRQPPASRPAPVKATRSPQARLGRTVNRAVSWFQARRQWGSGSVRETGCRAGGMAHPVCTHSRHHPSSQNSRALRGVARGRRPLSTETFPAASVARSPGGPRRPAGSPAVPLHSVWGAGCISGSTLGVAVLVAGCALISLTRGCGCHAIGLLWSPILP